MTNQDRINLAPAVSSFVTYFGSLLLCLSATAWSDDAKQVDRTVPSKKASADKRDESRSNKKLPAWSPEREVAALAFVRQHQPELACLLDYLRKNQPRQYQRAIRELSRTAERLSQTQERDPRRYELELQSWKTRSHIDLLAAKWQLKPDDELRERLRAAIAEQMVVQRELLTRERERLTQRLQFLDAQLRTLESGQQAEIERRMRSLTEGRRKNLTTPLEPGEPQAAKDER